MRWLLSHVIDYPNPWAITTELAQCTKLIALDCVNARNAIFQATDVELGRSRFDPIPNRWPH
jgi:hypothetical protein